MEYSVVQLNEFPYGNLKYAGGGINAVWRKGKWDL
jgi:hypothetical protein